MRFSMTALVCVILLCALSLFAENEDGILTTAAGTGVSGDSGDSGNASLAQFTMPVAVFGLSDGSFLIVDNGSNRVRKVGTDGVITTFAGTGTAGYNGDEGPAQEAELNNPSDVACDALGNTYIADAGNQVVRKVSSNGIITTVSTIQFDLTYPRGVAIDANNNLYIVDQVDARVIKVAADGRVTLAAGDITLRGTDTGNGGPAVSAGLTDPADAALASDGTMYILEMDSKRIRKVDTSGNISVYAGTGTAGYSGDGRAASSAQFNFDAEQANKLDLDPDGNLLVADSGNHVIRRIDVSSGIIDTVSGTGTGGFDGDDSWAIEGRHTLPYGVGCFSNGNIIIADSLNYRVRNICTNFQAPIGLNSTINVGDEITFTFDQVTTGGELTFEFRESTDTPMPGDFQINGLYLDINFSGGVFIGNVTIVIRYSALGLSIGQERRLQIFHYENGQWVDATVEVRTDTDEIIARVSSLSPFVITTPVTENPPDTFRRGDANDDGSYDVSDAVFVLLDLFTATVSSTCLDAEDSDDNGALEVTDAIYILEHLFSRGAAFPPPSGRSSGLDVTPDELTCVLYSS